MLLLQGLVTKQDSSKLHALKLSKHIYCQKQAGKVWYGCLCDTLEDIGFQQSKVDHIVYYQNNLVFLAYVDAGIFIDPDDKAIDKAIQNILSAGLGIQDNGHLSDYMGVNIQQHTENIFMSSQDTLIQEISKDATCLLARSLQSEFLHHPPKFYNNSQNLPILMTVWIISL